MSRPKSSGRFQFGAASVLLAGLVLLMPAWRLGDTSLYILAALVPCVMFLCDTVVARMFSLDRMLTALTLWFLAAGIAALAPGGSRAAVDHSMVCGAALIALLIGGIMARSLAPSMLTVSCTAFLGFLLLGAGFFPGGQSLPLSGIASALLLVAFAALFSRRGSLPALLLGIAVLALLLLRGNTGESLVWALVILLLAFSADGRLVVVLPALAVVSLLFFGAFSLSFAAFPVSSAPAPVLSAGLAGADTLPEELAALQSDSLFPLLAGHYGLVFSGLTVLLFVPFSLRGSSLAVNARTRFHALLAMGATLALALRALAALLSAFGFLPVSGLCLPFLGRSLPDLCAQLFLTGLLCGISGRNDADLAEDAHLAMLAK